jgi:glycylpeptide N-tetradecanoyltransferase
MLPVRALLAPGWKADYHCGVRASQSRKLVAFISAIPVNVQVRKNAFTVSEINFLVVHKKLRGKRLAPVLIKEITRRSNRNDIWQGLYTAGVVLPTPISTCRYYHRALDWKKLCEIGFSALPPGSTEKQQLRRFALPDKGSMKGWREMRLEDIDQVLPLLTRYLKKFEMAPTFTLEEFEHWFVSATKDREQRVVWAYVVEASSHFHVFILLTCRLTFP